MLFRPDVRRLLPAEEVDFVTGMYMHALQVRVEMKAPFRAAPPLKRLFYTPGCHEVAHAFARVMRIDAVDGEYAYLSETVPDPEGKTLETVTSTILHSWNEFSTPSGARFILDVFPDERCAIFPVLYCAPNPAYWIPQDETRLNALKIIYEQPMQLQIQRLAKRIRRIVMSPE